MGPLGLGAPATRPATSVAWERVRARWAAHGVVGVGLALVAVGLWVHPLAAVLPLAGLGLPVVREALADALTASPSASLAFGLAVVAAAAVGYASAGAVAPVVAWALVALVAQRALVLVAWTLLHGLGQRSAPRLAEWSGVAVAALLVACGWGLGWLPAVGDGAVAAVCTLAAGGILKG